MVSQHAVDVASDHERRSWVVRDFLRHARPGSTHGAWRWPLVQFWDDMEALPADVASCMGSWSRLETYDVPRRVFDDRLAKEWIEANLGACHAKAFAKAPHPAMRSDFFRLCYVAECGGCYVDADDRLVDGAELPDLDPGTLRLAPLCYDKAVGGMTSAFGARAESGDLQELIFYVNNNPLIGPPQHPVVVRALDRATAALLADDGDLRDVQGTTGPGNLTAALVETIVDGGDDDLAVRLLPRWDDLCVSEWPLGYRADRRNWRLWAADGGVES